MTKERRNKLMFRWSVFSAALIAAFWIVWYFTTGSVPVVESIKWTETSQLELPLAVSRWFDVLLGPVYSILIVGIFYRVGNLDLSPAGKKDAFSVLVIGLALGLTFGLAFSLVVGLGFGGLVADLTFGLAIAGLVVTLVVGLVIGLGLGFVAIFVFSFALTFVTACAFGLAFGLVFSFALILTLSLVLGLVLSLVALIKSLARWLPAKEQSKSSKVRINSTFPPD